MNSKLLGTYELIFDAIDSLPFTDNIPTHTRGVFMRLVYQRQKSATVYIRHNKYKIVKLQSDKIEELYNTDELYKVYQIF